MNFKEEAKKQCYKSSYKYRLGAVVVHRNKIVGKGCNKVHSTGFPNGDGKHAEIEALNDCKAKFRKNCTVYVCRISKDGKTLLAKPCKKCTKIMKKMKVKYVYYSSVNEEWTKIKL